ncbi:hypothetical protein [Thermococcus sp. 21S7]|uniref:hypothetical protein n=1 Tax=Thermococcus sp. 21S7 TaxID=1638221 RepID=UPI00143BE549|nr:hypothetical protein [Thermococcus sp. 21S7]NJE61367.1 hypothetical protein [Thermococcus sp. 21S7]
MDALRRLAWSLVPFFMLMLVVRLTEDVVFGIVAGFTLGAFLTAIKPSWRNIIVAMGLILGLFIGYSLLPKFWP